MRVLYVMLRYCGFGVGWVKRVAFGCLHFSRVWFLRRRGLSLTLRRRTSTKNHFRFVCVGSGTCSCVFMCVLLVSCTGFALVAFVNSRWPSFPSVLLP